MSGIFIAGLGELGTEGDGLVPAVLVHRHIAFLAPVALRATLHLCRTGALYLLGEHAPDEVLAESTECGLVEEDGHIVVPWADKLSSSWKIHHPTFMVVDLLMDRGPPCDVHLLA